LLDTEIIFLMLPNFFQNVLYKGYRLKSLIFFSYIKEKLAKANYSTLGMKGIRNCTFFIDRIFRFVEEVDIRIFQ
ncbi:hypothetical protein, partial [Bacillus cereus]|uniref:hypothetical protein n=1 Tax=Bacillus cereus TaxID=1396 RepID=UPI001C5FE2ED